MLVICPTKVYSKNLKLQDLTVLMNWPPFPVDVPIANLFTIVLSTLKISFGVGLGDKEEPLPEDPITSLTEKDRTK